MARTEPMAPVISQQPPIITLLTDFGLSDHYVAAMKAVLLKGCPAAAIVDITHVVPRHDIVRGSFLLERAVHIFPPGAIHVAVIDPGVGTQRRILAAELNGQIIVCPDNGLVSWAWRRNGGGRAHALEWRPPASSDVFQGRDIMAPAAAMLAAGEHLGALARPIDDPVHLDIVLADSADSVGRIIYIDHFGNATTNVSAQLFKHLRDASIVVRGVNVGPLLRTYADAPRGAALALIGSSGLLEVAVRDSSAAADLGLQVGDEVTIAA